MMQPHRNNSRRKTILISFECQVTTQKSKQKCSVCQIFTIKINQIPKHLKMEMTTMEKRILIKIWKSTYLTKIWKTWKSIYKLLMIKMNNWSEINLKTIRISKIKKMLNKREMIKTPYNNLPTHCQMTHKSISIWI